MSQRTPEDETQLRQARAHIAAMIPFVEADRGIIARYVAQAARAYLGWPDPREEDTLMSRTPEDEEEHLPPDDDEPGDEVPPPPPEPSEGSDKP
jgi:hypothetical protein